MSDTGPQDIAQVEIEFRIRINYKSGHQHTAWFTKFEAKRTPTGEIQQISYIQSDKHNIIYLGVDNIESIVQLEFRKKKLL